MKYCLSFIVLVQFFSCNKGIDATSLNAEERRELAIKTYKDAIFFPQGSSRSLSGIDKATQIDPTYKQAVYELSVAYLKRGMPHKWKPQYDKAVLLDSVTRIPWRGYLYLWFYRDYKKAITDFDMSDVLTPNFTDRPQGQSVHYWRGIAYLGLNDTKSSIAYFDKYIVEETKEAGEDWVELTAFLYRGIAYYESGNHEKALENFEKLLKYSENLYADGKYYKALIYKKQGKSLEAKKLVNAAIEDFNNGYYNNRPYVETLREIYLEDLQNLKDQLK
ncbi:MAG: tetratricopeptide repeat protein [Flavobacteriaceae bacterium]|nr:tetratricopeptide repeat protein [Flavobacteriaceae bacterium]